MLETTHRIIIGDSRCMKTVADESVQLIITSPPYWQLKDYGNSYQIGYNDSYEDYINNLNLVWKECHRVLEKGCRLCINIGDQFARSIYYGRYKVIPIRTEIIKFCETIGFDYMGAIIWQKVTTTNTTGGAVIMGSYPYPRNGILKLDYEFILILRKHGKPKKIAKERKENSKLTKEEWNKYFTGHWNFPGEKQEKHLAMFPLELPNRLIKMFSFVGDTVLDPFLGSGTTSLSAMNLNRNSIGFEINENFLPIIKEKLGIKDKTVHKDLKIIIEYQKGVYTDYKKDIKNLPYIFRDPLKMDKQIDPKSIQFGSKIDQDSNIEEEYYKVKQVLSPNELLIENDRKIVLLGVKPMKEKRKEAIDFLRHRLKGQKIFLRFDTDNFNTKEGLRAYVYLKNKTFINAHLIKSGLVSVDTESDYQYKSKFIRLHRDSHI